MAMGVVDKELSVAVPSTTDGAVPRVIHVVRAAEGAVVEGMAFAVALKREGIRETAASRASSVVKVALESLS